LIHFVGISADILTVVGAVLVGYATCMLQQGYGSSFFSKTVCFASELHDLHVVTLSDVVHVLTMSAVI
jgi:hypothetical protein